MPTDMLHERLPMEQARADFYALLAALVLAPPSAAFLDELAGAGAIAGDGALELAKRWEQLVLAASLLDEAQVREEYSRLFTATSDPLVNPYASFYLSGFLMDQPLADLRGHLGRLGLARRPGASELEDHLGALFETMRVLIEQDQPLAVQQDFFERHIHSWAARLTADLRQAQANFYGALANFIDAFLDFEAEGYAMSESGEQQ